MNPGGKNEIGISIFRLKAILKMYEEESRKLDIRVMVSHLF